MSEVRGRPFEPGNKFGRGRPEGSRNKSTIALQQLMENSGAGIVAKASVLALQGDPTALRICFDRLLPPMRNRTIRFPLGDVSTMTGIATMLERVLRMVASGKLTPAEGHAISGLLEQKLKMIETSEMEARVKALEDRGETPKP